MSVNSKKSVETQLVFARRFTGYFVLLKVIKKKKLDIETSIYVEAG